MKNGELIKYAALFLLVILLLYRKYGKKYSKKNKDLDTSNPGKELSRDDDYEPYSKKQD
jgi:hypothetical protein